MEEYEESFVKTLDKLNYHIKHLKKHQKNIHEAKSTVKPKSIKIQFLIDEIKRKSERLQKARQKFVALNESDDKIRRRNLELSQQTKVMR